MVPDEDVAQVRSATDIVTLIGEYTPLKRVGRRSVGLCPFHAEKTGSFSVNGEEGLYYCFGCQASGDAIGFLRAIEGYDFVEAVERLASRAGIAIRHEAGGKGRAEREEQQALKKVMAEAVAFYHDRLLHHADAARARQYLRSRGYDGDVVRQFKLGWSPERGSELVQGLGSPDAILVKAGLAHKGGRGTEDSFRGRVMFPIFDPAGAAIALGGRVLPEGGAGNSGDRGGDASRSGQPQPKYRNSPESPIYSKRRTLYGLNWARQGIVQEGEIVVCEGYTDVIGLFTTGVTRAVATCGTALTDEHFRLIARFAKKVVLAFDADTAGQSAAARFYAWEARDEVEVSVAPLPLGSDPGELAREDPEALRAAVKGARPFLGWRVDRALTSGNLRSPEGRARAAETAVAMIAEHPNNALIRDQYLVTIADHTRISVDRLRNLLDQGGFKPSQPSRGTREGVRDDAPPPRDDPGDGSDWQPSRPVAARRQIPGERAGLDALALAVHQPAVMAPRLDVSLFVDPVQRAAYEALASAASLHEAIEAASEPAADLLRRLAVSEPAASSDQTVVALVRTATTRAVGDLESDARKAEAAGQDDLLMQAAATLQWVKPLLQMLSDPGVGDTTPQAVTESADTLLGWLVSRRGEEA
ncbi:MAG: DNA primase [Acidimicrobiales bacterium]